MTTDYILEVFVMAYEAYKEKAIGMGKDPNSLSDFMGALRVYLEFKKENNE